MAKKRGTHHNRHTKTDTGGVKLTAHSMRDPLPQPCAECPLRRDSKPGYLGGYSPEMYIEILRSPASIACHSSRGFHEGEIRTQRACTGVAAFRANVGHICSIKHPEVPMLVPTHAHKATQKIGHDEARYFASDQEFIDHHKPGQEP